MTRPACEEAAPECESCEAHGAACDGGDHCDDCGHRMDGTIAATADVCHDCWRALKQRLAAALVENLRLRAELARRWAPVGIDDKGPRR